MHGLVSQNGVVVLFNDALLPKKSWFKFQLLNWSNCLDAWEIMLQLPISYWGSFMVTITSQIFINIFQTVLHFSVLQFRGNEKYMSFLLVGPTKVSESLKQKLKQFNPAHLRKVESVLRYPVLLSACMVYTSLDLLV